MKTANNLRVGNIIKFHNDLYKIITTEHVKPGKGGASIQVIMKNIKNSKKKPHKFRAEENVDLIHIYEYEYTLSHREKNSLICFNHEGEEVILDENIEENTIFLKEGQDITLLKTSEDEIIGIKMPQEAVCRIQSTDGYIKGQTESAKEKFAILDNGIRIKVPQYLVTGDRISLQIKDLTYIKKEK